MNAAQRDDELSEIRGEVAKLRVQLRDLQLVVAVIHPEFFDFPCQQPAASRRDRHGLHMVYGGADRA